MSYRKIISALSEGIADMQLPAATTLCDLDHDRIAEEIVDQQKLMPDYLHAPVKALTYLFDICCVLHCRARFQKSDAKQRRAWLEAWKSSRLGFCRNFVRFYESLFLLIALPEADS